MQHRQELQILNIYIIIQTKVVNKNILNMKYML